MYKTSIKSYWILKSSDPCIHNLNHGMEDQQSCLALLAVLNSGAIMLTFSTMLLILTSQHE